MYNPHVILIGREDAFATIGTAGIRRSPVLIRHEHLILCREMAKLASTQFLFVVCHWLCQCLPQLGSTGKASGTQPLNECMTEHLCFGNAKSSG